MVNGFVLMKLIPTTLTSKMLMSAKNYFQLNATVKVRKLKLNLTSYTHFFIRNQFIKNEISGGKNLRNLRPGIRAT